MSNIGVVGASGFVGQHLSQELLRRGHVVRAIVRTAGTAPTGTEEVALGDFTAVSDWKAALHSLDTVYCLAARAHILKESSTDPISEFRRINVQTTMSIAHAAVEAGTKRFIFLSSIGVNGETTQHGTSFTALDEPNPQVPYAISKMEAENELQKVHMGGEFDVVAIRSPLVYGPNAKGNFLRLLRLVNRGVPLPLASANNPRAMISIGNLIDALVAMLDVPSGEKMLAIVNDQQTLSTTSLIRQMASALEKPGRLFPCPPQLLKMLMSLLGMKREAGKLVDPLEVEISATWPGFSWQPPFASESEIRKAALWYAGSDSQHD